MEHLEKCDPTLSALRKDLRTSTAEGTAASVMVGIGETYFPAFVLALSGSQVACGLVTTVPLVAGGVLQLVSPWMVERWRSYRRWTVLCAGIQAASFVLLAAAALAGALPMVLAFAVVSMYWATGMASSAPWNAWMETLVPQRVRARYFAWRTRVGQWGVSAGFVAGGIALHVAVSSGSHLYAFALLFLAAAASRFLSAGLLAGQAEPSPPPGRPLRRPARGAFRRLADGADGRLLLYLLAAQAAVQVAAPYFNPYMLGQLQFSYCSYAVVVCAANVAKILFLPAIGRLVDRWGAHRVFWLSALAIVPLPGMWILSSGLFYLIGVQIFSGVAWGANDLASLMLFFETIPREKRVGVLTMFNLANAAATVAGSLLGAVLLATLGTGRETYLTLFALSTIARAAGLLLLARVPAAALMRQLGTLRAAVSPVSRPSAAAASRQQYLPRPHWPRGIQPVVDGSPDANSSRAGTA